MEKFLEVHNLKVNFLTKRGIVKAVDGINFEIRQGEKLGLVGESGCGKTVTALSIMRLIPSSSMEKVYGRIMFHGEDLLRKSSYEMRQIRGRKIAMIFQDPMTSLNPLFSIGDQIMEVIMLHQKLDKTNARKRAIEMLDLVEIPSPEIRIDEYPHHFSGGMRQRAMIAIALSCEPELLIADEPTTALDVSIQAQIIKLMKNLCEDRKSSLMYITHDLGVVCQLCDRIAMMYGGKIVEIAGKISLFDHPKHPYTEALLRLVPRLDNIREKFVPIPGSVPEPIYLPSGCRFMDRCSHAMNICKEEPELLEIDKGHFVACHLQD